MSFEEIQKNSGILLDSLGLHIIIKWGNKIMRVNISQLISADLDAVDELMKRYNQWLGFLPMEAIRDYLEKGTVLGAKSDDGQLVGYLLYAAYPSYFRITHLCVLEEYRGQGVAKRLINGLKELGKTQKVIKLHCRRDFPANGLWPRLGFVAYGNKPSRSPECFLTIWHLILAPDDQLELFQAKTSDENLDIVIDAQIFFDFDEPDSDKTAPSKALLSDFLVDSINLYITDELLNEIHRQYDSQQHDKSLDKYYRSLSLKYEPRLYDGFLESLKGLLPTRTASQASDVRHLAKTAASTVKTFVTRDHALLAKAEEIAELTGIEVVSPVDLIIRLHELSERQSYAPDRVAGLALRWARLKSDDLATFPFDLFLEQRETRGKFREKLESLIAQPNRYECELLWSSDEVIAIRVLDSGSNKMLTSPLARVARCADPSLFGRFLIADSVSKAVEKDLDMVKFEDSALTPRLIPNLLEMGFIKCNDSFVRFCFSCCLDRQEALSMISELCTESTSDYQNMSDLVLEQCCSPLDLESTNQKYFLIPIRSTYSTSLIDRREASKRLFIDKPDVLLRWDKVYYRTATHYKMLTAPGRILWYVSTPDKRIIAVSSLDEVVIDTAKELFRKFKKFGILEWQDLYKMCSGNLSKELMALKFSHTYPFPEPVSLEVMRTIFKENEVGLSLQGPLKLPPKVFHELFQRGYLNQS